MNTEAVTLHINPKIAFGLKLLMQKWGLNKTDTLRRIIDTALAEDESAKTEQPDEKPQSFTLWLSQHNAVFNIALKKFNRAVNAKPLDGSKVSKEQAFMSAMQTFSRWFYERTPARESIAVDMDKLIEAMHKCAREVDGFTAILLGDVIGTIWQHFGRDHNGYKKRTEIEDQ